MAEYQFRPVKVEAVQWTGNNFGEIRESLGRSHEEQRRAKLVPTRDSYDLVIDGIPVAVGHWVCRDLDDEGLVYPVDDEYFQANYDKARVTWGVP